MTTDQEFRRRYAIEKGRTALQLYDSAGFNRILQGGPDAMSVTIDLMTAVELLLSEVEPRPASGPQPAADDPGPGTGTGTTVTMTGVYGDEGWRPHFPGRRTRRD